MIRLDFRLIDPLGYITAEEVPYIKEADIATELFQSYLSFDVNGTDLSWNACIPMVDFARTMFRAVTSLTIENSEAFFSSAEYPTRWAFRLSASRVAIARDDLPTRGDCDKTELVDAIARFGVRVYDALIEAVPAARQNRFLSAWYPYEAMKAASS
jgi:hypothetical protein